ncbi:3-deoxy-D-manno-octulosonic-acid transferase [Tangfeifania diversioriginum]|uniref:3-deoxy-D-manno-octulosonic acid transferase n=1 Tax=Tangfeifania diversioriginum TaxID=1168035 RepID=A0A1M6H9Y4_9BACT|nr:glycosyltransferase N-terminal domain-containing protein [Tangfeifania diversioriginum]SHJ19018.1 3-deoxy-D-manno-octulosonic-acid transferase [Tangfeifania diversioriginum]
MKFLYKTGIHIYALAIRLASLFNPKARMAIKGRKNWTKNLSKKIETNSRYIWLHCASLGEFEQGRPVIEEIKKQYPQYRIILTFFSPSGYEIRKNYPLADIVSYLPFDTPRNAKKFLKIVQPEKAFFIKYEFWHFYISELQKQGIPVYLISGIFREGQHFFKNNAWGRWYKKMLFRFKHFFVQNKKSAELLSSIGVNNFTVSGDTRFDRVAAIAAAAKEIPAVEKFRGQSKLIIAGSTWKPDEELLAAFINNTSNVKMIVAPHEVSAANINRLKQMLKKPAQLFSNIQNNVPGECQVLIIDSIGVLSSLYRYGDVAYIGGGFGVGIHNILEAATYGLPVIFGPNYSKFKEAVDLAERGGAYAIHNQNELNTTFKSLLENPENLKNSAAVCKKYVEKNTGATSVIIKKVFNKQHSLAH